MLDWEKIQSELIFTAVRSRGPGGQNVNKVSSAAVLRWAFENSLALDSAQKLLVRTKLQRLINKDLCLLIRSDEFRDLQRNKQRCFEKLKIYIKSALHKPKPRKATRPTLSAQRKTRERKSRHSDLKKSRRKPVY